MFIIAVISAFYDLSALLTLLKTNLILVCYLISDKGNQILLNSVIVTYFHPSYLAIFLWQTLFSYSIFHGSCCSTCNVCICLKNRFSNNSNKFDRL